jgi:hypothetical protein
VTHFATYKTLSIKLLPDPSVLSSVLIVLLMEGALVPGAVGAIAAISSLSTEVDVVDVFSHRCLQLQVELHCLHYSQVFPP